MEKPITSYTLKSRGYKPLTKQEEKEIAHIVRDMFIKDEPVWGPEGFESINNEDIWGFDPLLIYMNYDFDKK